MVTRHEVIARAHFGHALVVGCSSLIARGSVFPSSSWIEAAKSSASISMPLHSSHTSRPLNSRSGAFSQLGHRKPEVRYASLMALSVT